RHARGGLEQVKASLNQLRCVAARRSARSRAKSVSGNTVERGDAAGARHNATRRAGVFCVVGSSKGLPVFPDTGGAFLLPTPQNPSGAAIQAGLNLLLRQSAVTS